MGDVVLVDVGAGKTDICLFNNGIPKNLASIPIGGNNISNDLAICGKFSFIDVYKRQELVEVTPQNIRMRKRILDSAERRRMISRNKK